MPYLNRIVTQSEKLVKYFQEIWRLQKLLDKILNILENKIELIHMLTSYELLQTLGLIPICKVNSGEWLSCYPERDSN